MTTSHAFVDGEDELCVICNTYLSEHPFCEICDGYDSTITLLPHPYKLDIDKKEVPIWICDTCWNGENRKAEKILKSLKTLRAV